MTGATTHTKRSQLREAADTALCHAPDITDSDRAAFTQLVDVLESSGSAVIFPSEALLSTTQVAALLGVSRMTVVRLVDRGELRADTRTTHRRIPASELSRYEAEAQSRQRSAIAELAGDITESTPPDRIIRTRLSELTPERNHTAVLDACALVPIRLATTLLWLGEARHFDPLWSHQILEEVERNLPKLGLIEERATHRVQTMRKAFGAAALVDDFEHLIEEMTCYPKDRHVLAAAVCTEANSLVTFNLKDFPPGFNEEIPTHCRRSRRVSDRSTSRRSRRRNRNTATRHCRLEKSKADYFRVSRIIDGDRASFR